MSFMNESKTRRKATDTIVAAKIPSVLGMLSGDSASLVGVSCVLVSVQRSARMEQHLFLVLSEFLVVEREIWRQRDLYEGGEILQ